MQSSSAQERRFLVVCVLLIFLCDRSAFVRDVLKLGDERRTLSRRGETSIKVGQVSFPDGSQTDEKRSCRKESHPMRGRVLRDVTEQLEVSFLFLFRVHRQRLVDRFSRLGSVPRVDDQSSVQRVSCCSGK